MIDKRVKSRSELISATNNIPPPDREKDNLVNELIHSIPFELYEDMENDMWELLYHDCDDVKNQTKIQLPTQKDLSTGILINGMKRGWWLINHDEEWAYIGGWCYVWFDNDGLALEPWLFPIETTRRFDPPWGGSKCMKPYDQDQDIKMIEFYPDSYTMGLGSEGRREPAYICFDKDDKIIRIVFAMTSSERDFRIYWVLNKRITRHLYTLDHCKKSIGYINDETGHYTTNNGEKIKCPTFNNLLGRILCV